MSVRPDVGGAPVARRGLGLLAVAAVLVGVGVLAAVELRAWRGAPSLGALGDSNDAPSRQEVELYGKIRIPPNAGDLHARLQTFVTKRTLMARFSIVPGDLSDLLKSGSFPMLRSPPSIPDELSPSLKPPWWTPETARSYLVGAHDRGAILVDTGQPGRYVVYLLRRS